jgi:NAD(P)-dependent dehydrogenase (short-subunit alcohol dehydrogenase family)
VIDLLASLDGARAAVFGGARGMGAEIARGLAEAGSRVAVVDLVTEKSPDFEAARTWRPEWAGLVSIEVEARSRSSIAGAYRAAEQRLGGLDVVVNTIGLAGADTAAEETTEEQWQLSLDVNLSAVFYSCQEAAVRMLPHGRGSIVNFSSLSGQRIATGHRSVPYHTTKAAVEHLTRALAAEWAGRGLRVNAVAPGLHLTPRLESPSGAGEMFPSAEAWRAYTEEVKQAIPLGRIATASEIVPLVLFLSSDSAAYITGAIILQDGGRGLRFI